MRTPKMEKTDREDCESLFVLKMFEEGRECRM